LERHEAGSVKFFGICASSVGLNEETIRGYIRDQEEIQRRKGETDQREFDFE
jgi:hypothetical protein